MPGRPRFILRRSIPAILTALLCACGPAQQAAAPTGDAGPGNAGDGGPALSDGGPSLSDAGSRADASVTVDAGSPDLSCGAVEVCAEGCGSNMDCRDQCYAEGTTQAQNLAKALDTCLDALCSPTGVCSSPSSTCSMCIGTALANGCAVLYGVCENDMSGSPPDAGPGAPDGGAAADGGGSFDGGSSSPDGGVAPGDGGLPGGDGGVTQGDGGAPLTDGGLPTGTNSCFEVSLCSNGCGSTNCLDQCLGTGTAQAQTEYTDLLGCTNHQCPGTDGGVCDSSAPGYNSTACGDCENSAQSNGGPCFADAISCEPTQCASSTSCQGGTCDSTIGFCVQCLTASDCGSGEACIDYVCRPSGTLSCIGVYDCMYGCQDRDCSQSCIGGGTPSGMTDYIGLANCQYAVCPNTDGGICDAPALYEDTAACNNCIQNAQNTTCLPQIEACISNCVTSADCVYDPTKPACDTDTATCVQCARTSDCAAGEICASNVCIRTCATTQDCPSDQTCMDGICVAAPCHDDADCAGTTSTPHCDVATGVCGP